MTHPVSRRRFLKTSTLALAASAVAPYACTGRVGVEAPTKRMLGRTGFEVTTLGLGGQASLQWTPEGVDPVAIILKALEGGVNYLDTSNVYGPSQVNFGKAFRAVHLVPGESGYDEGRRGSICLASKTMIRYAKGSNPEVPDRTQGAPGSKAVDDVKRSLSQLFGDGEGNYPAGAYLDLCFIHNLNTMAEVDAIYEGLEDPDPRAERLGALAALVDYRDGTNLTGLNPGEEKLIRGIGISGHFSSPVMMECLQRDERDDLIDAMLIAINANDRLYLPHQYNAIPVAAAKNVGVVAMKVFADGAMYTKEAKWSREPEDVVLTVGSPELPSRPLVEYALSVPGVDTAIIGIGHIDSDPRRCQLSQNLSAAQVAPGAFSRTDLEEIEAMGTRAKEGLTNWFQVPLEPLGAPREAAVALDRRDEGWVARLEWQTAYASDQPIRHYEIRRDGQAVATVEHRPQTTKAPFAYSDALPDRAAHTYTVVTVDADGRTAESEPLSPPV
jgi:aryl-alcohol dehydrogenase-like predicted oxidoreductase